MIVSLTGRLKRGLIVAPILLIMSSSVLHGRTRSTLQTKEIVVIYEEALTNAAQDVVRRHLRLKRDLEEELTWSFQELTTVLLVENRLEFEKMVGNRHIVAIAIPQRNLVVIDFSRANARPFSLESILKHEMCHLLLHQHIKSSNLPKWLDEGICQLLSDGMAEIIIEQQSSLLDRAILTKKLMNIRRLDYDFPFEDQALRLAYEQSKSLVAFMNSRFGRTGLIQILGQLKQGHDLDTSIYDSLSIPMEELERQWRESLKRNTSWFSYLAKNLYLLVFFIGALITIAAFVRLVIKKRKYMDESD